MKSYYKEFWLEARIRTSFVKIAPQVEEVSGKQDKRSALADEYHSYCTLHDLL